MKRARASVLLVVGAAALAAGSGACGARSTIEREAGHGGAGGDAPLDDGGAPDGQRDGATEAGAGFDVGGAACVPDGELCSQPEDCCNHVCNVESSCGPIPCRKEGSFCLYPSDCCRNACLQTPSGGLCLLCVTNGQLCSDAGVGCCSTYCNEGGRCSDPP